MPGIRIQSLRDGAKQATGSVALDVDRFDFAIAVAVEDGLTVARRSGA